MKVIFRRILYGDRAPGSLYQNVSPTDTEEINIEWDRELEFCCGEMKTEWREGDIVGFGPRDNWGKVAEEDIAVHIYQRILYESYEWYPIKFCPFCGEAIEYDEAPALTQVKRIKEVPAIPATEKVTYESVLVDNAETPT